MYTEKLIVEVEYNQSVHELLEPHCHYFLDQDSCYLAMDHVSWNLYGKGLYTPSRKSSTIEDYISTRTDIVRYLISRYNYKKYLEIGCASDSTFDVIHKSVDFAIGVDPVEGGTHRTTSDLFFSTNNEFFDIIFIDGDHHASQALKDLKNSLRFLAWGGTIVMHDCNPRNRDAQEFPIKEYVIAHSGDVWKVIASFLRLQDGLEVVTLDVDQGTAVVRRRLNRERLPIAIEDKLLEQTLSSLTYEDLLTFERDMLLRLVSLAEFRFWLDSEIGDVMITN